MNLEDEKVEASNKEPIDNEAESSGERSVWDEFRENRLTADDATGSDVTAAEVTADELRELLEKTTGQNRASRELSKLCAPAKEGRSGRIDSENLKELKNAKRLEKVFNKELVRKETKHESLKIQLQKGKAKKKSDRFKKKVKWFLSAASVPAMFAMATIALVFGFMCQIQSQFCATKAVRLIARGDHDKAYRLLHKSLVWNPYNSSASLESGRIDERRKDHHEAYTHFSNAVKVNPNRVDLLDHKGAAALKLKQFEDAAATYTHLLQVSKNSRKKLHHYGNRAVAYTQLGQYDKAIDDFTNVLKMKRTDQDALMGRASCHNALKEHSAALADLDRLLTINPKHYNALILKGWILQSLTLYNDAQVDYEAAIAIEPNNEKGYMYLARNLMAAGNVAGALAQLDKVIALNPKSSEAHAEKGKILLASGQHKEALQQFKSVDNVKVEENYFSLIDRAKACLGAGENKEAIRLYSKAIALKPDVFQLYFDRAQAEYSISDYKHAIKDLDEAIKLYPTYTDAMLKRAQCNIRLGNETTAISDFRNAIASNPASAKPHIEYGKFNLQKKQFVTAKECFDTAIKWDPKDKTAKELSLVANQSLKKLAGSKPLNLDADALPNNEVAEINSADFKTLLEKGYQAVKAGKVNYAEAALERAVRLDPNSVLARRYLATTFMIEGKASQAENQVGVLNKMGGAQDSDNFKLATTFRKAGNCQRAIEYLDRHLASHPTDANALIELSEAHAALGNIDKAADVCFVAMNKLNSGPGHAKLKARYLSLKESQNRALERKQESAPSSAPGHQINSSDSQG